MFIKRRKGIIVADGQQYGDNCCRALARQYTLYEESPKYTLCYRHLGRSDIK